LKKYIKKHLLALPFDKHAQSAYNFLQKLPEIMLASTAPKRHYERCKKKWQKRWADTNFNPKWKAHFVFNSKAGAIKPLPAIAVWMIRR
jgi:hypothetical protein